MSRPSITALPISPSSRCRTRITRRTAGCRAAPRAVARRCSCRPRLGRRWRRSSVGHGVEELEEAGEAYSDHLGAPDLHSLARDEARDRAEHRNPMVAGGAHSPTLRAGGNTPHPEAIIAFSNPNSKGTQGNCHCLDTVRLLYAQLLCAAHFALAARAPGDEGEERQLVDEPRHLLRLHRRRDQLGRPHLEVADPLPPRAPAVEDGDARAHALEHVEETRPRRVEGHVVEPP